MVNNVRFEALPERARSSLLAPINSDQFCGFMLEAALSVIASIGTPRATIRSVNKSVGESGPGRRVS